MARRKSGNTVYLRLTRSFIGVPNQTILSQELNGLKVHSRWLYMVLLTRFNREKDKVKRYYPFTYKELREITRYDNRRIAKCIEELEAADFIEVCHGGKNNPSTYRPILKWVA